MAETKNGATRLYLYLSIAAAIFFFIVPIAGGAYWISNLENRVHSLEQTAPASLAATISRMGEITRRVELNEAELRKQQLSQASNCQQFAKIETQFGTTETVINEAHVNELRSASVLWQKSFGLQPAQIYYDIKIPHEVIPC